MKPGASAAVCKYNDRGTAGREDRRGSGALSPKRSLVSGAGEQIIGDDAAFIAVADPV